MQRAANPGSHWPLYFFLSYAHSRGLGPQDRFEHDALVHRFEQDLDNAVSDLAGHPRGTLAGLSDRHIPVGGNWPAHLADALARCHSFIALYSEAYFGSQECGREWAAFSARIERDIIRDNVRHNAIIPVIWLPISAEMLPEKAKPVHFTHASLGVEYNMRGLRYLMTHREMRDHYLRAVAFFAARIVEVAENDAPSVASPVPPYGDYPNAFADPPALSPSRRRLRIVVAAANQAQLPKDLDPARYGDKAREWRPYVPAYSGVIATTARRLAESLGFQAFTEDAEHCRELLANSAPTAPTVLFVDPWVVSNADLFQRLLTFDRSNPQKSWVRVVIPWNRAAPADPGVHMQLDERLEDALRHTRERCRRETPRAADGLENVEDLISELPEVFGIAERHFLAAAATYPPRPRSGAGALNRPRLRGPRLLPAVFGRYPAVKAPDEGREGGREDGGADLDPEGK